MMNKAIEHFLFSSYAGALLWIGFGVLVILFTIKNPQKNSQSVIQEDIKGWGGGIFLIAVGIIIIIMKIQGKL